MWRDEEVVTNNTWIWLLKRTVLTIDMLLALLSMVLAVAFERWHICIGELDSHD
jgi:hypothetical protein